MLTYHSQFYSTGTSFLNILAVLKFSSGIQLLGSKQMDSSEIERTVIEKLWRTLSVVFRMFYHGMQIIPLPLLVDLRALGLMGKLRVTDTIACICL